MNCGEMTDTLTAFVDGYLDGAEGAAVKEHLSACAGCRGQVRWLEAMKVAAKAVPAPTIPGELKATLLKEARQASRRKRARAMSRWLAGLWPASALRVGVAAGLATAAVAVMLRSGGGPGETVPVDDMLAAHRAYAMTMPLTSQETTLSGLVDALAGGRR